MEEIIKMEISSDEGMSPQLKEEIQTLRGIINKGPNSKRFIKTPCKDAPAYTIKDIITEKEVVVPLYSLSEVMKALVTLFE